MQRLIWVTLSCVFLALAGCGEPEDAQGDPVGAATPDPDGTPHPDGQPRDLAEELGLPAGAGDWCGTGPAAPFEVSRMWSGPDADGVWRRQRPQPLTLELFGESRPAVGGVTRIHWRQRPASIEYGVERAGKFYVSEPDETLEAFLKRMGPAR
ncbi:MAG: hypothetical protein O2894_00445 [Planctomycetota bacterium]|nr:hypothetical protein [Planctomycetota bacterium]